MGIGCGKMCDPDESKKTGKIETINLTSEMIFPQIHFAFSNQHADKLEQADCVIVNASKKHPENQFYFKHLNPKDLNKLKELITKDEPGQFQVINNPLNSLKVKDIIVTHLPVWGHPQAQVQLVKAINAAFEQVKKRNYKTVIFTEFQEELGLPLNVVTRLVMDIVFKYKDQLMRVLFNVEDLSRIQYLEKQVNEYEADAPLRTNSLVSSLSK